MSARLGRSGWCLFALLAVGIVGVQAGIYAVLRYAIDDPAVRGQFGDAFGVTNSLFSGLALAGLICTLLLQQQQIRMQVADAREIRAEAAAALTGQQRSNHLSALTFLMDHYDVRLARVGDRLPSGPAGAEANRERTTLQQRRQELETIVAGLHAAVVAGLGDDHVR